MLSICCNLYSNETRKNMSYSRTGSKNGMFNKKHKNESKEKMKINMKGRIPWNKGKTNIYSEETIKKMRNVSHKSEKNPMFGKHHKRESLLKMSNIKKRKKTRKSTMPLL